LLLQIENVKNKIKIAIIEQGNVQVGFWLALANAYSAEVCATADFDWLLIDGEHAPNDLRSILAQLQAIAPYNAHAIVRPPVGDVNLLKQLLDVGVQTFLIPMVETEEQARSIVAATRYPMQGIRGVGGGLARASRWNAVPNYLHSANAEICVLVQVESVKALKNLDAISAVEGIDGVFIGPSDLAATMGHLGEPTHPEVLSAIEDAIERIKRAGKPPGILTFDEPLIRRYAELGCRFIAVGADVILFARAVRNLGQKFKTQPAT
jgi:4-hydroxy-2-oxoheptanedioate aldolase